MLSPKILRIIIGVKIFVAFVILLRVAGGLHIGDMPIVAADKEAKKEGDDKAKKVAQLEEDAGEELEYSEDGTVKQKRKSFLDQLLKIPKIDTANLKKEEVGRYLAIIDRKKEQIESRIERLKEREKKLEDVGRKIDTKLKHLDEERRFFADTIQQERTLQKDRSNKLVEFYKKMSPKKAAPVFEKMNKDLVVEMFNRLPQKQIMKILEIMAPDKSVELSEYYGRIRSAKEYDLLKEMNKSLLDEFQDCKKVETASNN